MLSKKAFLGDFSILGKPINPVVYRLAIGYLIASILDVLLTRWALDIGLKEWNPLFNLLGYDGFFMVKLVVATFLTGLMIWRNKVGLSIYAVVIMVGTCGWNLSQILA